MVALCLTASTEHGAGYALGLGVVFASIASITSFSRLLVTPVALK